MVKFKHIIAYLQHKTLEVLESATDCPKQIRICSSNFFHSLKAFTDCVWLLEPVHANIKVPGLKGK